MFYRTGVMAHQSFTLPKRDFLLICSCHLDLDPMTFIYEIDPGPILPGDILDVQIYTYKHTYDIYRLLRSKTNQNMNLLREGFRKLSSDRETDRHDRNYIPRHFVGGQQDAQLPQKYRIMAVITPFKVIHGP